MLRQPGKISFVTRPVPGVDRPPLEDKNSHRHWLAWAAAIILTIGASVAVTLFVLFANLDPHSPELRLEVIRTGLTAGAATGALMTLLYAQRKQLLAEEVARDEKTDAIEKRTTDLYVKGVEQLGSNSPIIRLGGVFALERLGEGEPALRDTIIDLFCAVLRDLPVCSDAQSGQHALVREITQTAIHDHLAKDSPYAYHKTYWPVHGINLVGVHFHYLNLDSIWTDTVQMDSIVVHERTTMRSGKIRGLSLDDTEFRGDVKFDDSQWSYASFRKARFKEKVSFKNVRFEHYIDFTDCIFERAADFDGARIRIKNGSHVVLPRGWRVHEPDPGEPDAALPGESGSWGHVRSETNNQV